jgi:FtsP/CotA-like multicopper oxidase with cupredoxin domain
MGDMGMGGMGMGGMDGGDVTYKMFLVNGHPLNDPDVFKAKPGQRVRIRIINAGADTMFYVALANHTMTITHTDGYAVAAKRAKVLQLGMGERYDVTVTLKDGVFPLVAIPIGKSGVARALVRTGTGTAPAADFVPSEFGTMPTTADQLRAAPGTALLATAPARVLPLALSGSMAPYRWTINGRTYDKTRPLEVRAGEMTRLEITNMSQMSHPMHLHGHTFQIGSAGGSGVRKDTVLIPPMGAVAVDLLADNPGKWMVHCHNAYHAEAGMMTRLEYTG